LDNIINPLKYLQEEARKEGMVLDGLGAIELIKRAEFYQDIAYKAAQKIRDKSQEGKPNEDDYE